MESGAATAMAMVTAWSKKRVDGDDGQGRRRQ